MIYVSRLRNTNPAAKVKRIVRCRVLYTTRDNIHQSYHTPGRITSVSANKYHQDAECATARCLQDIQTRHAVMAIMTKSRAETLAKAVIVVAKYRAEMFT